MKLLITLLSLLSGCAVTPKAALRHEAYTRLSACIKVDSTVHCLAESAKWCQEHDLERDCGTDGFWPP